MARDITGVRAARCTCITSEPEDWDRTSGQRRVQYSNRQALRYTSVYVHVNNGRAVLQQGCQTEGRSQPGHARPPPNLQSL